MANSWRVPAQRPRFDSGPTQRASFTHWGPIARPTQPAYSLRNSGQNDISNDLTVSRTIDTTVANYGFIIDNRRCIGCHACTVACKSEHQVPVGVNRTWVKYVEKGEYPNSRRVFSVMRCNHCDNAPCVEICPVTALYTREDGIVDFDNRRCIGCKACTQACPYDALYIDPESHTAAKCNYCAHRVDQNLEPACVNVCPTQAIISGDLDDPNSRISQLKARHQVTARKVEKGTEPRLYYLEGDLDSLEPTQTDQIEESIWSEQEQGVGHWANHQPHALDRLGQLLNLGDTTEMIEPLSRSIESTPEEANKKEANEGHPNPTMNSSPRRVYDAPQKGVMWGWQVSGYLWTKSIAAGVCLLPLFAKSIKIADIGYTTELFGLFATLLFLGLTGILLIWDLDQPKRFLNVVLRPQWRSWLVKGAYIITGFSALVTLYLLTKLFNRSDGIVESLLRVPLMIFGILAAIYTAFLFAQAKGRDFWQSPLLPLHMLLHSLIAGSSLFAITYPFFGGENWAAFNAVVLISSLSLRLGCDFCELYMTHATRAASKTATMIRQGKYAAMFWGGAILVGTVLPIILASLTPVTLPVAGVLALVGVFLSEHIWVRAPQMIPLS